MSNEHKYCIGKDDHSWEVGYDKGYQQGRADAINEFANKLLCLVSNNCKFIVTKDFTYFAMEQDEIDKLIYETADELKEHNK